MGHSAPTQPQIGATNFELNFQILSDDRGPGPLSSDEIWEFNFIYDDVLPPHVAPAAAEGLRRFSCQRDLVRRHSGALCDGVDFHTAVDLPRRHLVLSLSIETPPLPAEDMQYACISRV